MVRARHAVNSQHAFPFICSGTGHELGLSAIATAAPKNQAAPHQKAEKLKAAKRYKPGKKFKAAKAPRVKTAKPRKTKHA